MIFMNQCKRTGISYAIYEVVYGWLLLIILFSQDPRTTETLSQCWDTSGSFSFWQAFGPAEGPIKNSINALVYTGRFYKPSTSVRPMLQTFRVKCW